MEESTFKKEVKDGKVELLVEKQVAQDTISLQKNFGENNQTPTMADYVAIVQVLRKVKRHRTTAPTNTPKSFLDAIEFYSSGGTYRVYFYVDKVWKYITLT